MSSLGFVLTHCLRENSEAFRGAMDKTDKMRETWSLPVKDEKMGYDNPVMANAHKLGSSQPGRPEKESSKMAVGVKNTGPDNDALKSVYATTASSSASKTKKIDEKSYEPFDHRDVKHPTTFFETLVCVLKVALGTGIFAMPDAFHNAGYAVGTIGTILVGILSAYCLHILVGSEYELCKRRKQPSMTYPATAYAAMEEGPECMRKYAFLSTHICNLFMWLYQVGSCCIYVVFVASNIKDVVDNYYPNHVLDLRLYMFFLLIPLVLTSWVRNLKYLAPLSSIANALSAVSFAIIFYYLFDDVPSISSRSAVAPFASMPLFFCTVLFAMESIGVIMPLENEMEKPKELRGAFGVLNCAMIPICLLYTFVGFFGYLKYGDEVKGSITLSLPSGDVLAQAARLMLAFAIFISHALMCFVAVDISWHEYIEPKVKSNMKTLAEYILRTSIVVLTIVFAAAIPYLELFISLIGALCLSTMGVSFPAVIQLFTHWYDYTGFRFALFFLKNLIIIIIASLGFIVGTYTSVQSIVEKFV